MTVSARKGFHSTGTSMPHPRHALYHWELVAASGWPCAAPRKGVRASRRQTHGPPAADRWAQPVPCNHFFTDRPGAPTPTCREATAVERAPLESGPSGGPAAARSTPLGDVSNIRAANAAAQPKPARCRAAAAAADATAVPPGLEEPAKPRGRLPVAEEAFEAFGDALGCLR